MPVTREDRRVQALAEELNRWLRRESAEPVYIATDSPDLSVELKRGDRLTQERRDLLPAYKGLGLYFLFGHRGDASLTCLRSPHRRVGLSGHTTQRPKPGS